MSLRALGEPGRRSGEQGEITRGAQLPYHGLRLLHLVHNLRHNQLSVAGQLIKRLFGGAQRLQRHALMCSSGALFIASTNCAYLHTRCRQLQRRRGGSGGGVAEVAGGIYFSL